jgi:hypothetical protein
MPDESLLREKAREAIRSGKLPIAKPDRTYGGPGSNEACPVCGKTVRRDQMELEIEFSHDSATPGLDRYRLHPRCFAAWEFERTKAGDSGQGRLSTALSRAGPKPVIACPEDFTLYDPIRTGVALYGQF